MTSILSYPSASRSTEKEVHFVSDQHKAIVRSAVEALGRGDVDGFLADATDDFKFSLGGQPPGGNVFQGKALMVDFLKELFGSRLEDGAIEMKIEEMISEGDTVVERASGRALTVEGERYDNVYCRIWQFREGKIAELFEFMDTELARRCLWSGPILDPVTCSEG